MKITLKVEKEYDVKYLKVQAGVRHWEDAKVDGQEDTEGELIPCRSSDYWEPVIDVTTGIITNWEQGRTADIHYKVCDDGAYTLIDNNNQPIICKEGYVPDCLCPNEVGYGDYIIMTVDADGKIGGWDPDFDYFNEGD